MDQKRLKIRNVAIIVALFLAQYCLGEADQANLDLNSSLKQIAAANQERYKEIKTVAVKISITNQLTSAVGLGPDNVSKFGSSLAYAFSGPCYRIDCDFGNPSNKKDSYITMAYDGTTYNFFDRETQILNVAKGDNYFKSDPRITGNDALTKPFIFLNNDPLASFMRFPMLGLDKLWSFGELNPSYDGILDFNGHKCLVLEFDNNLDYVNSDINGNSLKARIKVFFAIDNSLFPIYWIRKSMDGKIIESYEVKTFQTTHTLSFPSLAEDVLYTAEGKPGTIRTLRLDSLRINSDLNTDFQCDPSQARGIFDKTTGKTVYVTIPK